MTKLVVWCIGLVVVPVVAVPLLLIYVLWLMVVGTVGLCALLLRAAGLTIGVGWVATATGMDAWHRRRGRSTTREVPVPLVQSELSLSDIARLRASVGATALTRDELEQRLTHHG